MAINAFFPCNYRYPYTNDHELNLGWVLATIKAQESELSKFVALNTVKYADPFDWNITTQYATNTVVFNPADMTAYISVQPVPSGVQIDNTDYWTPIFTLADIFTAYKTSITPVEQIAAKPATQAISKGQLLWIDNVLYEAVRDISQGTVIVPGENVVTTNISDELAAQVQTDNQLQTNITAEQTAREQADQQLQQNIQAEQTAREQADQQMQEAINNIPDAAFVNIADYGAKADAYVFDNNTKLWWRDNTKTVKPTNDSAALQAALDDCLLHNKAILYIPTGNYYMGAASFTVNASKIMIVCGSNVNLISEGLSEGAFFTFETDANSATYSPVSEFCKNLNIYGCYSQNKQTPTTEITGFLLKKDCYFTHGSFYNCKAACFNTGLVLTNGSYKFSIYNFTAQACDTGVRCESDYSSTIPAHFYNLSCDCCNTGLVVEGSGGTRVFVIGGTFEYNRFAINSNGIVSFSDVRFEFDGKAAMTDVGSMAPHFIANNADQSSLSFYNCTFFMLSHYAGNVGYWWPSADIGSSMPPYIFVNYSTSAIFAALSFINCVFTSDQVPANNYLCSAASGRIFISGASHPSGQKYVFSQNNNIISNNISNLDPRLENMSAVAVGSDYGFKFGDNAGIKIPARAGEIIDFVLDLVSSAQCTVFSICGTVKTQIASSSFSAGKNNMCITAPAGTEYVLVSLPNGTQVQRNMIVNIY